MPGLYAGTHDEDPKCIDDRDEAVIDREPCPNCGERHLQIEGVSKRGGIHTYTLRCPTCDETCQRKEP